MAKSFNFNTLKKKFVNVTLKGEDHPLLVLQPNKKTLDQCLEMSEIDEEAINANAKEVTDSFYDLMFKILNNNMKGEEVVMDRIEKSMDLTDMVEFLTFYMSFISELVSQKN